MSNRHQSHSLSRTSFSSATSDCGFRPSTRAKFIINRAIALREEIKNGKRKEFAEQEFKWHWEDASFNQFIDKMDVWGPEYNTRDNYRETLGEFVKFIADKSLHLKDDPEYIDAREFLIECLEYDVYDASEFDEATKGVRYAFGEFINRCFPALLGQLKGMKRTGWTGWRNSVKLHADGFYKDWTHDSELIIKKKWVPCLSSAHGKFQRKNASASGVHGAEKLTLHADLEKEFLDSGDMSWLFEKDGFFLRIFRSGENAWRWASFAFEAVPGWRRPLNIHLAVAWIKARSEIEFPRTRERAVYYAYRSRLIAKATIHFANEPWVQQNVTINGNFSEEQTDAGAARNN